jgi:hypothetical protein
MKIRRSFNLSLPVHDPQSAQIQSLLAQLEVAGMDVRQRFRQLIVLGLEIGMALARIEAKLDSLTAPPNTGSMPVPPLEGDASAILEALLDFAHLVEA